MSVKILFSLCVAFAVAFAAEARSHHHGSSKDKSRKDEPKGLVLPFPPDAPEIQLDEQTMASIFASDLALRRRLNKEFLSDLLKERASDLREIRAYLAADPFRGKKPIFNAPTEQKKAALRAAYEAYQAYALRAAVRGRLDELLECAETALFDGPNRLRASFNTFYKDKAREIATDIDEFDKLMAGLINGTPRAIEKFYAEHRDAGAKMKNHELYDAVWRGGSGRLTEYLMAVEDTKRIVLRPSFGKRLHAAWIYTVNLPASHVKQIEKNLEDIQKNELYSYKACIDKVPSSALACDSVKAIVEADRNVVKAVEDIVDGSFIVLKLFKNQSTSVYAVRTGSSLCVKLKAIYPDIYKASSETGPNLHRWCADTVDRWYGSLKAVGEKAKAEAGVR